MDSPSENALALPHDTVPSAPQDDLVHSETEAIPEEVPPPTAAEAPAATEPFPVLTPETDAAAQAQTAPDTWTSGDWTRHALRNSALQVFSQMSQPAPRLSLHGLEALPPRQRDSTTSLMASLTQSSDPLVRADAFEAWAQNATSADLDALLAAADGSDASIQRTIEAALQRIASQETAVVTEYLLTAFTGQAPQVASAADSLLPALGGSLNEPMRQVLADTQADSARRRAAAYILGRTRDADAVPLLLDALREDDAWLAIAAAQALHVLSLPHLVPEWIAALDHPQAAVRQIAVSALAALGGEEAFTTMTQLATGQRPAPASLQTQALYAIAEWPAADAVPVLTQVAQAVLRLRSTARRLITALTGVPFEPAPHGMAGTSPRRGGASAPDAGAAAQPTVMRFPSSFLR